MTYRRLLLGRWSRRDRLAVAVVAVGVAFLVGTVLLVVAAGAQTAAIANEYGATTAVTTHGSVAAAEAAAGPDATVLPYAVVRGPDGDRRYVLARPPAGADALAGLDGGSGVTLGTIDASRRHRLAGGGGTVSVTVSPRQGDAPVPADWYVADRATVDRLGPSGAFAVRTVPPAALPLAGVPLRGALAFFRLGTREALATLGAVVVGSGVLVAVVVYSVTRMTVRDRRETLRIVRATGGARRAILGVFALRAGLLTGTGAAVGYAVGVIAVNAAVSLAVALGVATSLSPTVTPAVAGLLAPLAAGVTLLGAASGALATLPAIRGPPVRGDDGPPGTDRGGSLPVPSVLAPTLLDARALVPTAATLAAFVAFVVLVTAMAGVVAPLAGDGATVTQPGANHAFASTVPAAYADALRARGIPASAEILLFESRDGQPYLARGANFTAFASVTAVDVVAGRRPTAPAEAAIGADLAWTLEVGVGDELTLGGSTRRGLTRVRIVGVYDAPGPYDDQLVVPLSTARALSRKPPGTVQFVRAARLPETDPVGPAVRVVDVAAPATVRPNSSFEARVTLRNTRSGHRTTAVTVRFANRSVRRQVAVAPGETTVAVAFETGPPGTYRLRAGEVVRTVRVASPDALGFAPLPDRAPPNASLLVRVRTAAGDPVSGATVSVGDRAVRTDADGTARVRLTGSGTVAIRARAGNRTAVERIEVAADAGRRLLVGATVAPSTPDVLTEPAVAVRLFNPWGRALERTVVVAGPDRSVTRRVTLAPGETRVLRVRLPRRPPGTYEASVRIDGRRVAGASYRVTGDDRLVAALASGGRAGTTGMGRAIETAFGNLRLVLGVVLGLAAAMTVGGTTATFAQSVHARRRTIGIHRATGAPPARVARIVFADALRIGAAATVLGLLGGIAGLRLLGAAGYLTVFGVRLDPVPTPATVAGVAAGALAVTLAGAGFATVGLVTVDPSRLLAEGSSVAVEPEEGTER